MRLPIVNNYTLFTDLITAIGKLNPADKVNASKAGASVADRKCEADRERIEKDRSINGKIDVYA